MLKSYTFIFEFDSATKVTRGGDLVGIDFPLKVHLAASRRRKRAALLYRMSRFCSGVR